MQSELPAEDDDLMRDGYTDPFTIDRATGILTPAMRATLMRGHRHADADAVPDDVADDVAEDVLIDRVRNAMLDFHILAVYSGAEFREAVFYENGSPNDFEADIPSDVEAAFEDIIAFLSLGVAETRDFTTSLETGIERAHQLDGETATVDLTITETVLDTATEIADRLDTEGVDVVTPVELQTLYFAGVITKSEYKDLFREKFNW